jgi:hypothetical protein
VCFIWLNRALFVRCYSVRDTFFDCRRRNSMCRWQSSERAWGCVRRKNEILLTVCILSVAPIWWYLHKIVEKKFVHKHRVKTYCKLITLKVLKRLRHYKGITWGKTIFRIVPTNVNSLIKKSYIFSKKCLKRYKSNDWKSQMKSKTIKAY